MKTCPKCVAELEDRISFCPFCGHDVRALLEDEHDPLLGRTLVGNFRLEQLIGVGAMGRVYRATQLSLSKPVAVKVLHRRLLGDSHLEKRFHREAQAASRLSHPNSIQIIDYGTAEDGSLFIVMEYLEGRDLGRLIREDHPLAWCRACDLLAQVCSALDEAHAAGIIHRDLKPENIVVIERRSGGELVKVLDFGIAKIQDTSRNSGDAPLTFAGMVCGTPEYMSPEQARGVEITIQSDLYALGVILYQMLTGVLPFEAPSTLAVVTKQLSELPVPPSTRAPAREIPPALERLCLAALEKDPARRPGSAREMMDVLQAVSAEQALLGGPAAAPRTPHPNLGSSAPDPACPLPFASSPTLDGLSPTGTIEQATPTVPLPAAEALRYGLAAAPLAGVAAVGAPTERVAPLAPRRRGRRLVLALVALLLLFAGAGAWLILVQRDADPEGPEPAVRPRIHGKVTITKGKPAAQRKAPAAAASASDAAEDRALGAGAAAAGGEAVPTAASPSTEADGEAAAKRGLAVAPADLPDTIAGASAPGAAASFDHSGQVAPAPAAAPASRAGAPTGGGAGVVRGGADKGPKGTAADAFSRGRTAFRSGDFQGAIAAFLEAERLGAADPELYFELGRCYARTRNHASAILYYNRFIKLYTPLVEQGRGDPGKLQAAQAIAQPGALRDARPVH